MQTVPLRGIVQAPSFDSPRTEEMVHSVVQHISSGPSGDDRQSTTEMARLLLADEARLQVAYDAFIMTRRVPFTYFKLVLALLAAEDELPEELDGAA